MAPVRPARPVPRARPEAAADTGPAMTSDGDCRELEDGEDVLRHRPGLHADDVHDREHDDHRRRKRDAGRGAKPSSGVA